MKKPRLLLILTEFPPRIGGMQTHAIALASQLYKKGYELEVLSYRANRHEEKDAAKLYDYRLPFPVRRIMSRLGFWRNLDLIEERAHAFKPDMIYSSTVFYGFLKDRLSIPVICRSVGNDVMRPWLAYPFPFLSRLLGSSFLEQPIYDLFKKLNYPEWVEIFFHRRRRELMIQSAQKMDLVLANSRFTARLLQDIGIPPLRIEILVGGVDAGRFKPVNPRNIKARMRLSLGLPEDAYLIVTACRLVAKKGIDFLLRSFFQLRISMPDAQLMIIGDGKHLKKYKRMSRLLGLQESVIFTGRVPQSTIHHYYWASDLFVLASRIQVNPVTGMKDAETMGRVLCEANASGIPVIASSSGGIPSVIADRKNGLLFEPDNESDLIAAINLIRKDKKLSRKLVSAGKRIAEKKFDWSQIMKAHEKAIKRALGTHKEMPSRSGMRRKSANVSVPCDPAINSASG